MSTLPIPRPAVTFSINNPFPTSVWNIIVCHPNHHPQVVLFFCAALDYDPENSRYGCNHRLVLDACEIIANNRQGQLATLQHNEWNYVATDVPLLTPAQYYFIVENDPTLHYPIVTQFNAWKFPPEPPAHWGPIRGRINIATTGPLTSSVSEAVQHSDRACIITRTPIDTCQCAFLSPRSHPFWFYYNDLAQYNIERGNYTPEDVANGVCLRADLNLLLDSHSMVFYPAQDGFVAYFLKPVDPYAGQYHRTIINIHPRISRAYLYARFAFNVISHQELQHMPLVPTVPLSVDYIITRVKWAQGLPSKRQVKRRSLTGSVLRTPAETESSGTEAVSDDEMEDAPVPVEQLIADWHAKNPQIRQTSGESESSPVVGSVATQHSLLETPSQTP